MSSKTILILGGYGNTGIEVVKLILQATDCHVIIAGRSVEKANKLSDKLNSQFSTNRATGRKADASDQKSLIDAFQETDMVIVCSGTAEYTTNVASAALDAGIDYFDIHFSTDKQTQLKKLEKRIETEGRCFITEGGFHPGLPAVLVHYTAKQFDQLDEAIISSVIKINWTKHRMGASTIIEFLKELTNFKSSFFKNGKWGKARLYGMLDSMKTDFGKTFGKQTVIPMHLEEMTTLPESYPTLKKTGFYVGGFNWFIDWLFIPFASVISAVFPKMSVHFLSRWMEWGLVKFSKPPYGTILKLEASGKVNQSSKSFNLMLSHKDGYIFTAIPVFACLLQYLQGKINKPGLWLQAHIVEPIQMIRDMNRLGIDVKYFENNIEVNGKFLGSAI